MMFSIKSLIHQIASVALGLLVLSCGRLSQSNNDDTVCDIDINDTAMVKSAIYSVYASDTIYWPGDFDDLDTLDLVNFVSIKACIPSLDPDSLTKIFGPCIRENSISFDDTLWFEAGPALRYGWTKEDCIRAELDDAEYFMPYDEFMPTLLRLNGKFGFAHKSWSFDDNHFLWMYYLSSDSTLIPIGGCIIHKAHPIMDM